MSDEKEAAARRPYYDRAASALDPFTANAYGMAWRALDASGVWERIEVLDGRTVALADGWRFCAETNAKLRAENERLREALRWVDNCEQGCDVCRVHARAALASSPPETPTSGDPEKRKFYPGTPEHDAWLAVPPSGETT